MSLFSVARLFLAIGFISASATALTNSSATVTQYTTVTSCTVGAVCSTSPPESTVYSTAVTSIASCAPGVQCSALASLPTPTPSAVYTTYTVSSLTTYCPEATVLTFNDETYTVTSASTLTITNCPCTLTSKLPEATAIVLPTPAEYVTYTVSTLVTYCSEPTQIVTNGATYTVTSPSTLTITDCPCTLTSKLPAPTATIEPFVSYLTYNVSTLTTYCSEPTIITTNEATYTVTAAPTTLTITDCPCKVTSAVTYAATAEGTSINTRTQTFSGPALPPAATASGFALFTGTAEAVQPVLVRLAYLVLGAAAFL